MDLSVTRKGEEEKTQNQQLLFTIIISKTNRIHSISNIQ